MIKRLRLTSFLWCSLIFSVFAAMSGFVYAEGKHGAHKHAHEHHDHLSEPASFKHRALKAADVTLINQNSQSVRFRELIDDKIVVVNFVYTSCEVTCQMLGLNFSRLAKKISHHLGESVQLISVSIDPAVDTPERLKTWSEKFGGHPGWMQLTGETVEVEALLKSLEVYTADKSDHSTLTLVGNGVTGEWRRLEGLSPVSVLSQQVYAWLDAH